MSRTKMYRDEVWEDSVREAAETPLALDRVRYAAALKPLLALPEDARILEAGCAGGRILRTLHALGYRDVTGLEPDPSRLEAVKRAGGTRATLVCSEQVPFDDASFDAVVSAAVIEHVADPAAWLGELARVVKPGGMLSLTTHAYMWRWLKKLGLYKSVRPIDEALWPGTVVGWARAAGLEVAGYGGFTSVPEQEWYLGKQLRRLLSPGRLLYKLTGIRTGRRRTYAAYEHVEEVPGIEAALDRFELSPREDFRAAVFSYESYYWFHKPAAAGAIAQASHIRAAA